MRLKLGAIVVRRHAQVNHQIGPAGRKRREPNDRQVSVRHQAAAPLVFGPVQSTVGTHHQCGE